MEDSYTVHRRRKAAARKREKTPEPPRHDDDDRDMESTGEDDSATRAKMERMVEDTEKMAEDEESKNGSAGVEECEKIACGKNVREKKVSPIKNEGRKNSEIENEAKNETEEFLSKDQPTLDKIRTVLDTARGVVVPRDSDVRLTSFEPLKDLEIEKTVKKIEEKVAEVDEAMPGEAGSQNVEPVRLKKRTKDKFLTEKKSYGTDSSDADDRVTRSAVIMRRKKSPEVPKVKSVQGKNSGRSRTAENDTDEDRNTSNNESRTKPNREKRHASKHRYSTGTEDEVSSKKPEVKQNRDDVCQQEIQNDSRAQKSEAKAKLREKRSVSRHRYPSDTDDDFCMKKSETFPQRSSEIVDKQIIRRSASEVKKKQIIPLSDDSLIQDFAKAQEEYLRREKSILEPDFMDDDYSNRTETAVLRKRKVGVLHSDPEEMLKNREKKVASSEIVEKTSKSWFSWVPFLRKKKKIDDPSPDRKDVRLRDDSRMEKVSFFEFLKALREIVVEFQAYVRQNPRETEALRILRNRCIGELILTIIYLGLGAFVFRFTEGAFETFYKCGVKRVKRDFLDNLWNYSHNMREEDWKSMARRKLMEFEEQLHNAHEAGVHSYSGQKNWTFLNAVVYCLTVITTIGYGHISPRTMAGRAITIVYAIFGIPIFLIILADFGKLFTRGIKFLWAFVRRLYYTGSCRKVRRTGPVQEVMKGVQLVYDFAMFRRPSQLNPEEVEEIQRQQTIQAQTVLNLDGNNPVPETPGTPAMSNFAIDDEFNLPISVAISILLGYIFVGATAYHMFEDWDFFESFYFVFISMSTIGFGDFVPKNPIFMMFSIIYLVFGLALTSMCINVVQTILSDSFKQASHKISATIGFEVPPEEEVDGEKVEGEDTEVADVQVTVKEAETHEGIAPKAKQEDADV